MPRPRRVGVAAVEFALVLPILMAFLLGIWEVGRFIDANMVLQGAAREGARQAAAGSRIDPVTGVLTNVYAAPPGGGSTAPDLQSIVTNYLAAEGCNTANVTVTYQNLDPAPSADGYPNKNDPYEANRLDHLRVTVTIPYKDIRWSPTQMFIDYNATLSATVDWVSMRDDAFSVNTTIPNN